MRVRAGEQDLHGHVPDSSPVVMLVIDAINDFTFEEGSQVLADARPVAERIQRLKRRTRRVRIPTVYVNDNFGRWRSDFRALISHCLRSAAPGRSVTRLLRPDRLDYFVLKPKHSAVYSTALELLLEHFHSRTLILTGLLADSCVLTTAQDAYARLSVPRPCRLRRRACAGGPPPGACANAPDAPCRHENLNETRSERHARAGAERSLPSHDRGSSKPLHQLGSTERAKRSALSMPRYDTSFETLPNRPLFCPDSFALASSSPKRRSSS